jgi:hypothetical protein
MVFGDRPIQYHEVQILTASFQFNGQLETAGAMLIFLNDPDRSTFSLHNVHLTPLTPGSPLQGFFRPQIVIRRSQIALLYLTGHESRSTVRLLRRREPMVVYTPAAVCKGYFHMADEANVSDLLDIAQGDLVPMTETQIFPLIELPAPFPAEAELLLVGRSQLECYHPA